LPAVDSPRQSETKRRPGYAEVLRVGGLSIFVHWTFPLGGLVVAGYAQATWRQAIIYCVCYVLLVAAHELGHASAALSQGVGVKCIELVGFGGRCRLAEIPRSIRSAFLIYSGGMLVQVALFALAAIYIALFGWPKSTVGLPIVMTLTFVNLVVFLMCVIPHTSNGVSSDGTVLWRLLMHVARGRPSPFPVPAEQSPVFPPETSLLSKVDLKPEGFVTGIEILNDAKTPMDFVVWTLSKNLRLESSQAMEVMLTIHARGGVLWSLESMKEAERVAAAITEDCHLRNQSLVCRAVDARETGQGS
jgi:ATP-dependent Clp protease adapter protein ClpS